jgi:hypothetical protein
MSSTLEEKIHNFAVTEVTFDGDYFSLHLIDGRVLSIPYEIVPSLSRATPKQRKNCEVGGMGTSLHWPDIDEDLTVEGLVLGRRVIDWQKTKKKSRKTG